MDVNTCFDEMHSLEFLGNDITTGTTIIAATCKGGVIIGSDSRTSSGPYIVNRVSDKITHISDSIIVCRSGSAADTQFLADLTRYYLSFSKSVSEEPNTVKEAAYTLRSIMYPERDKLMAGMIVAGFDSLNGPQVYSVPLGGLIYEAPYIIGGSGSVFLYSYFDLHYKPNMNITDCVEFVKQAVDLAVSRDGSSGGVARLAVISKDGIHRLDPFNISYKQAY